MRAGKLDKSIEISRSATTLNAAGTPLASWTTVATVRAQVVQASTEEFIKSGAVDETAIVFRIRWLAGITLADRVLYRGDAFNVKAIKELGRRAGLELRCVAIGGA